MKNRSGKNVKYGVPTVFKKLCFAIVTAFRKVPDQTPPALHHQCSEEGAQSLVMVMGGGKGKRNACAANVVASIS